MCAIQIQDRIALNKRWGCPRLSGLTRPISCVRRVADFGDGARAGRWGKFNHGCTQMNTDAAQAEPEMTILERPEAFLSVFTVPARSRFGEGKVCVHPW